MSVFRSRRDCFYFGTLERHGFIQTPLSGADASPSGWGNEGTYLNGGGFALNSWGSHKRYTYEWPRSSSRQQAQQMKSFSDGSFGRGLIYFQDPLTFDTNVLPAKWADPSIALGLGGKTLVKGVTPTAVATAQTVNELPVSGAVYDLAGVPAGFRGPQDAVFVIIPEGFTLMLGAFYTATGTGGVFASPRSVDGTVGAPVKLSTLATTSDVVVQDSFSGASGVWLWVGRTSTAASTVTLRGMVGRLIETANTTTREVARNYAPPIVGSGTWAEVRRNLLPNPSFEAGTTEPDDVASSSTVTKSLTTLDPFTETQSMRLTAETSGSLSFPVTSFLPTEGIEYTLLMYVRPNGRPLTVHPRIKATRGEAVTIPADVWTEIRYTAVAGAGNVIQTGGEVLSSNGHSVGDTIDIGAVLLVEGNYTGDYFDGSTPTGTVDPDMRTRWLGTPNASESVMEIETVAGYTAANCIAGVSTRGGKPAVRIIPTGTGESGAFTLVTVTEDAVTGLGIVSLDAPLQGTLGDQALALNAGGVEAAAPNLAGDHPLRVMGGEPTGGFVLIALANGATLGNGDVWWTDIGLFAGDYDGEWFDGNTPSRGDIHYSFDGNESVATYFPPQLTRTLKGPWIGGQGHAGVRFVGKPTYIEYTGVNGGQIGFAATFVESEI